MRATRAGILVAPKSERFTFDTTGQHCFRKWLARVVAFASARKSQSLSAHGVAGESVFLYRSQYAYCRDAGGGATARTFHNDGWDLLLALVLRATRRVFRPVVLAGMALSLPLVAGVESRE